MEQENKIEQEQAVDPIELNAEGSGNVIEIGEAEHHHHHRSRSHHSSHSDHSSKKHHSKHKSSHKKRKKESLAKRFRSIFDKKNSKRNNVISIIFLFVILALLVVLMYNIKIEMQKAESSESYQDGASSSGNDSQSKVDSSSSLEIPAYWEKMIKEKTNKVQSLQTAGGKDSVSFVWASDTHIPDNHTARTDDIGKLMAKMMDNCDIPFAVLTGDIGTRNSYKTEEELDNVRTMISSHLAPLWGTDRLLVALGNHDGCFGDEDDSLDFKKHLTPGKLWQWYFRGQALDSRRVFSDDGTYFYVDNTAQKTRFIVLNSQYGGEYLINSSGEVVNDNFEVSCYGQEQLDWLANVALDMPEGYGAVITSHVPPKVLYETYTEPYTVDYSQICGIINAYNKKTTFSGSYTDGVDGWSNSSVSVDFSDAKGEIIAMFTGHVHHDSVDTETLECPLITIISSGASVNWGEEPDREFYTDTETSFDVVTINRKTRTIYCTRVGAGEDRVIEY